jgi:hypothetical protein
LPAVAAASEHETPPPMRRALVLPLLLTAFVSPTTGAETVDRGDWFKSLTQPESGESCCDISHCFRTDADWREGGWWAEVRGRWVPVPRSRIVTDATSIDGSAYVCSTVMPMGFARPVPDELEAAILRESIICFVPPDMGS